MGAIAVAARFAQREGALVDMPRNGVGHRRQLGQGRCGRLRWGGRGLFVRPRLAPAPVRREGRFLGGAEFYTGAQGGHQLGAARRLRSFREALGTVWRRGRGDFVKLRHPGREGISYELETGAGQRFGSLHEEEVWLAFYARWKYFPWNDYLRTTVAASTGVNYASAIPQYEVISSSNNQGERLLHYFSPELTLGLPSMPDTDFVIRSHHRSGGGQFFGNDFPGYGSLFHGVKGGVQYLTFGVRQHF
jgi:hypothetical protein